tara:strand:+ start:98 stop:805 length:708 start_codon:yes stop_codon:yes gene_type:complete
MICSQCNKEFTPTGRYQKNCSIKCTKKKYSESHKGKLTLNKAQKKFRESTHGREALKKYDKEYAQTDAGKETKKKANKNYRKTDKSKIAIKRYTQSEKGRSTAKKYNQSDKGKKSIRKYVKIRRMNDPIFKLTAAVRNRTNKFLKSNNIIKKNKTFEMVGCTPEFLKKHLEKQFHHHPDYYHQMNWLNHTLHGWHIDHKIPLGSAKTDEDVIKLSHYTNLRPMWAEYNIKKGNKY